jgi:ParB family chromosome partitioning protein
MLQQAIVENVQREELNPLEEAAAYQQLIEDFSLTHDDVATRVGKSRTTITNTLRLLQLPPSIQRHLKERALRMGHARALLGTPDRAFQEQLAKRAVAEELSVREVEEAIRNREDSRPKSPSPRAAVLRPPGLLELEELLGDYLETRVGITMGPKRGKVEVEFATLEDLERIYRVITEGRRAIT